MQASKSRVLCIQNPLMAPRIRGFLGRKIKMDLTVSFVLGTIASVAFWKLKVEPHRQRYADFYRTYDAEAEFENMKNAGVFNSVPSEGSDE